MLYPFPWRCYLFPQWTCGSYAGFLCSSRCWTVDGAPRWLQGVTMGGLTWHHSEVSLHRQKNTA